MRSSLSVRQTPGRRYRAGTRHRRPVPWHAQWARVARRTVARVSGCLCAPLSVR